MERKNSIYKIDLICLTQGYFYLIYYAPFQLKPLLHYAWTTTIFS